MVKQSGQDFYNNVITFTVITVSEEQIANCGIALAQTMKDPSVRWLEVSAPSFWLITV